MTAQDEIAAARPDIVDRHGKLLATDVSAVAVYAEPRKMGDVDLDNAIAQLSDVIPDLDTEALYQRMKSDSAFIYVVREVLQQ